MSSKLFSHSSVDEGVILAKKTTDLQFFNFKIAIVISKGEKRHTRDLVLIFL